MNDDEYIEKLRKVFSRHHEEAPNRVMGSYLRAPSELPAYSIPKLPEQIAKLEEGHVALVRTGHRTFYGHYQDPEALSRQYLEPTYQNLVKIITSEGQPK